jgi:hypothetical protein
VLPLYGITDKLYHVSCSELHSGGSLCQIKSLCQYFVAHASSHFLQFAITACFKRADEKGEVIYRRMLQTISCTTNIDVDDNDDFDDRLIYLHMQQTHWVRGSVMSLEISKKK